MTMTWIKRWFRDWRKPRVVAACRKHYFGSGVGEGPCPVCGVVTTFTPKEGKNA